LVSQIFYLWQPRYFWAMSYFAHQSEENYLKTLYKLNHKQVKKLNNITLAKALDLNPATVLEMVRKLAKKNLLEIKPDKSLHLTEKGNKKALLTIRKHRLWEVFLVEKLQYKWNEVHELAEQLEHIESPSLIDRLEVYLGSPSFDPHGDPIPDKNGRIKLNASVPLSTGEKGKNYRVMNLAETSDVFLSYLEKLQIKPGIKIKITDQNEYDQSFTVLVQKKTIQLSEKVAGNILVQPM
jgi:DtxR family transcriptional regulator, Mn-dependent transcriptional regulator